MSTIAAAPRIEALNVPADWRSVTLKDVSNPVRGGSPRPAGDSRYFDGDFIPWLTVASLTSLSDSHLHVSDTESRLTEAGADFSRRLSAGTLILANSGATLGVAKILGIECCANDGIAALLDLDPAVSPVFLAYFLNSKTEFMRKVIATGNGQPNLNTTLIGGLVVPLPLTRREQDSIAEALSDADAFIESLEQLLAKKRLIKQGVMQELLTGKTRLPGFDAEWESASMGALFEFSGGYTASRDQLSSQGHCYLHYGDIHSSTQTYIDLETDHDAIPKLDVSLSKVSPSSLLQDGDIVFVDASEDDDGTSRHVVIVNPEQRPFIAGLHTIVASGARGRLAHEFRRFCFQIEAVKHQFRFFAVGTKVSGISKSNIAKVVVRFPSLPEQIEIARVLADIDSELIALESKLTKARLIKQGMMQELLTGRIRLI